MSDAFDPDAWPHTPASGGSRPEDEGGNDDLPRRTDDNDDEYDALNIDESGYGNGSPGYDHEPAGYGAPSSGYGGTNYEDDDEYGNDSTYDYGGVDNEQTSTSPRAAARDDSYDDYGYDSYDDDDDRGRDYDNYDDFDQDHKPSGARKLLVAGVAIVAVLLLLIVGLSALGGGKKNNNASQTTTTAASNASTSTTLGATTPAPADVTNAVNQALAAWGQFAVDGNLDDVRPYFVNSGPQFTHFQAEAPNIAGNPPGGAPLTMTMTNPQTYQVDPNHWLLRGTVVVSRPGNANQSFPWEIGLIRQNAQQPWQIQTVRQY